MRQTNRECGQSWEIVTYLKRRESVGAAPEIRSVHTQNLAQLKEVSHRVAASIVFLSCGRKYQLKWFLISYY